MQAQQNARSTRSLEELLGAFQSMRTAEKPLHRSQSARSELALAAMLHASKIVASRSPESTLSSVKRCKVRSSSLPIGIPTYGSLQLPQPVVIAGAALSSASTPSYPAQSGSSTLPMLFKTAEVQAERPAIKSCLYKTERCRGWEATGRCRYGSKCQFAHGDHELQLVMRHPKYKTEICGTFARTGCCRYGKRCRFIHPETSTDGFFLQHMSPQTDITLAGYQPHPQAQSQHPSDYQYPQVIYPSPNPDNNPQLQAATQYGSPSVYSDQSMYSANASHSYSSLSPYASPRGSLERGHKYSVDSLEGIKPHFAHPSISSPVVAAANGASGLLGSCYRTLESARVHVPGDQLQTSRSNTSPSRSVLDYVAAQGHSYHMQPASCYQIQAKTAGLSLDHFRSQL
ncbi:hypothetical protein WJX77_008227 [Trebouxia sp. C0004]